MDIDEAENEVEAEGSNGDTIKIGVDVVHPEPNALAVFPVSTIVVKLVLHKEAIQGLHENLLEIPTQSLEEIEEELRVQREEINETRLRNTVRDEGEARDRIEHHLGLVQEELRQTEAIAKYERNRANLEGAGGAGENVRGAGTGNAGGNIVPEVHGCSYKTFLNYKPHSFKGTKGVVGLSRRFEKMDLVFQISKCVDEDKVKYVVCTLEGNDIQKIEQELWNLTMKGDDIDGYTNLFHKLDVMCPTLVTPEYKKNEHYIWGLPERVQGSVTSSKPATIHEAVNMAHGLVDKEVRAKATRISDNNKRKWEEQQRGNNNDYFNNTHHHQQNRGQKAVRAYAAAQLKEGVMRETYRCITNASCITSVSAQLSVGNAKE
ncbi:hypothetical protein Tco_1561432 [Tanacetum coccineum]